MDREAIWPEGLIDRHTHDNIVDPSAFRYVGDTRTRVIEGKSDGERWDMTKMALLETMGIETDVFRDLVENKNNVDCLTLS